MWVDREVHHWLEHRGTEGLLLVLTDGEWAWDTTRNDFDPDHSSAVPPSLRGSLLHEPRHLDLRWAQDESHLDLRNPKFRDAVAELAAPMHGVPKDDLDSEDLRQYRRTRIITRSAIAVLSLLLVVSLVAGGFALVQRNRADDQARRAEQQARVADARRLAAESRLLAGSQLDRALLLSIEGRRLEDLPETKGALLSVVNRTAGLRTFIPGAGARVAAADVSPDGTTVAIVGFDGKISLVDLATRRVRKAFPSGTTGECGSSDTAPTAPASPLAGGRDRPTL